MKNKIPYIIISFGFLFAIFSLLSDAIGLGKPGIQAAQIVGMELGVLIALFGFGLMIFLKALIPFSEVPPVFWVVLGLLPAFVPFLVSYVFFDPSFRIQYPEGYLPKLVPIGADINLTVKAVETWLQTHQTGSFVFTPVANLFFTPLVLLGYPKYYYFITMATLVSYLTMGALALKLTHEKKHAVIVFITIISIFSYGLMFELERGQSHTIALMLVLLSLYIFHKHPNFRLFAYIFFSISIQLKFYPALFVILFVENWQDWMTNLKRFAALGIANFLLLFLLGYSYFAAFYNHMTHSLQDAEVGVSNHSIRSFQYFFGSTGLGIFSGSTLTWLNTNVIWITRALYLYFLLCFLILLVNTYKRKASGFQVDLFLACVVGSLVIPTVNHDYTLPMLTVPFALSISNWSTASYPWAKWITNISIVFLSFVYALTLFPYDFKPLYFQNALPMIFIILTAVTIFNTAQNQPLNTEQTL